MVATAALSCRHLPWPLVWLVVTLIFLTLLRPICLRFLLCPCLSFCRSCPSCTTGCCIASPHAAASPANASCRAVASRSASLPPLVRLVVALILLTPPHPIWRWITWGHRLLLSPCHCLSFLCSRASCPAGSCCVASPHAIPSPASTSASCCPVVSCSAPCRPFSVCAQTWRPWFCSCVRANNTHSSLFSFLSIFLL